MRAVFAGLGVFLMFIAAPTTLAGPLDDPSPYASDAIRVQHTVRLRDSFEGFTIDTTLQVHEVDLPPLGGRTAAELRAAPAPLRAIFEAEARARLLSEARRAFPDAHVALERVTVEYGLDDGDADPYRPPVNAAARIVVALTADSVGLGPDAQTRPGEVVRAFFYSGGVAEIPQRFSVAPGWSTETRVEVPPELETLIDGHSAAIGAFGFDNLEGRALERVDVDLALRLRPHAMPDGVEAGPRLQARILIHDKTPLWKDFAPWASAEYGGDLFLHFVVPSLDAGQTGPLPLPRGLTSQRVSADLLRVAVREGLVEREDLHAQFEASVASAIEATFGEGAEVTYDWAAFDAGLDRPLGGPDGVSVEPLTFEAHARVPISPDRFLPASGLARMAAMTVGLSGEMYVRNPSAWDADYEVLLPVGASFEPSDSSGRIQPIVAEGREGFAVALEEGETVSFQVSGRTGLDLVLLAALGLYGTAIGAAGYAAFWLKRARKPLATIRH